MISQNIGGKYKFGPELDAEGDAVISQNIGGKYKMHTVYQRLHTLWLVRILVVNTSNKFVLQSWEGIALRSSAISLWKVFGVSLKPEGRLSGIGQEGMKCRARFSWCWAGWYLKLSGVAVPTRFGGI